jgi:DNA-binding response OmpR family regulator
MTAPTPTVLIAEHDAAARAFLADNLEADHYWALCAGDKATALELLSAAPDALIVDLVGDTLALVDAIRQGFWSGVDPQLPILVLTSRASELQCTRLLERGADDVVCKPYSYPELRARLGALLRRAHARHARRVLRAGPLRLDLNSRRVWVRDVEIERLRGKEYELLLALIAEPDRVFTRQELLQSVWGLGSYAHTRTLDSHAARLRARLQVGGDRFVRNIWGVGYRLVDHPPTCP